jgi:hypothetical protein
MGTEPLPEVPPQNAGRRRPDKIERNNVIVSDVSLFPDIGGHGIPPKMSKFQKIHKKEKL